jgi:hypothetical protein
MEVFFYAGLDLITVQILTQTNNKDRKKTALIVD